MPRNADLEGGMHDVPSDLPVAIATTPTAPAHQLKDAQTEVHSIEADDSLPMNATTEAQVPHDLAAMPFTPVDGSAPSSASHDAQSSNDQPVKKRRTRSPSINVMLKTQLINEVAQTANLKKTQAGRAVNALLTTMREALVCGEDVGLPGLGVFWTVERKERIARNPQTGERMNIPERRVVNFKAGQKLKEIIIGFDKSKF